MGKADISVNSTRQRRPDPLHPLQASQRSERATPGPVVHDPRRERRTDAGNRLDLVHPRLVEVHAGGRRHGCHRRRSSGRARTRWLAFACDLRRGRRVNGNDLPRQGRDAGGIGAAFPVRTDASHRHAERGDGRKECERLSFRRCGHARILHRAWPRARHQNLQRDIESSAHRSPGRTAATGSRRAVSAAGPWPRRPPPAASARSPATGRRPWCGARHSRGQ